MKCKKCGSEMTVVPGKKKHYLLIYCQKCKTSIHIPISEFKNVLIKKGRKNEN